ncbi:hypothetical protein FACS1894184_14840 [Clostridia bacterium]|nr:hypothetical protein FACS1894184_14840 [Clostridia bacterium]
MRKVIYRENGAKKYMPYYRIVNHDTIEGIDSNNCKTFTFDMTDAEQVMQYPWHVRNNGHVITKLTNGSNLRLETAILGYSSTMSIEFVNSVTTDCRRRNIRLVKRNTHSTIDMIGKVYNRLTVVEQAGKSRCGDNMYVCICECGRKTTIRGADLRSGHTKSCGHCLGYAYDGNGITGFDLHGRQFIVDLDDWDKIKGYQWHVIEGGYVKAVTKDNIGVRLHRIILDPPEGYEVDHIDGHPSNCRKMNLRLATHQQNSYNTKLRSNNTSGCKGVTYCQQTGKYRSRVQRKHLGCYNSKAEATLAYNANATMMFGEYARLNEV